MTTQHAHEFTIRFLDETNTHVAGYICTECTTETPARTVCEHPTGTTLVICDSCITRERNTLDAIADHTERIIDPAETYTPVKAYAYDLTTSRTIDPARLPHGLDIFYDDDARGMSGINTQAGVWQTLTEWADTWAEAAGDPNPGDDITYLKTHIVWAAHNPGPSAFDDYRAEMRALRARVHTLDPTTPARVPGTCLTCGGPLTREWTPDGLDDKAVCVVCERAYTDPQLRLAMEQRIRETPEKNPDAHVTATEASRIFPGLPAATIRSWVKRGHLESRGLNRQGDPVYRVGDLSARLEARMTA